MSKPNGRWFAVFVERDQDEPRLFAAEVVAWVDVDHTCSEGHPPTLLPYCVGPSWDGLAITDAGNLVGVFPMSELPQELVPPRLTMTQMHTFAKIVLDAQDHSEMEFAAEAEQAQCEDEGKVINLGLARLMRDTREGNDE